MPRQALRGGAVSGGLYRSGGGPALVVVGKAARGPAVLAHGFAGLARRGLDLPVVRATGGRRLWRCRLRALLYHLPPPRRPPAPPPPPPPPPPRPPPPPPPPPIRCCGGRASSTVSVRPSNILPFSSWIALRASSLLASSTKTDARQRTDD